MKSGVGQKLAYTVEEAAELLSISRAQIYRLIDTCQLGSVNIGRSRRITKSQLEAYVAQLEAKSTPRDLHICPINRRQLSNLRTWKHEQKS